MDNICSEKNCNNQVQPSEYRKTGRNYIIKKSAMERLYGKKV